MPVYASFDYYPDHYSYLTPGKRYEARPYPESDTLFYITDDAGDELTCLWKKCNFLHGVHDWTRHEEPDAEPTPELPDDLREISATDEFVLLRTSNGGWVVDGGTDDTPILAAFTNTADLLTGLPALLGGAK